MAKRVIHTLVDDLDGSDADESIRLGLDGTEYEIDLNAKNAAKLRAAIEPFLQKATRMGKGVLSRGLGRPTARLAETRQSQEAAKEENQAVRVWANENGYSVAPRGAIKQSIKDAYKQAQSAPPPPPVEPLKMTSTIRQRTKEVNDAAIVKTKTAATKGKAPLLNFNAPEPAKKTGKKVAKAG